MINWLKKLFGAGDASTSTKGQQEGKVKFFNYRKGFGFITLDGSDEEIFVHKSNVIGKIKDKNRVTFNIEQSKKGPIATNVRALKK